MGKRHQVLKPGISLIIPFIDNIKKKDDTKMKNNYQKNKMETRMDLLKNYAPKMNNRENKISDYFNE